MGQRQGALAMNSREPESEPGFSGGWSWPRPNLRKISANASAWTLSGRRRLVGWPFAAGAGEGLGGRSDCLSLAFVGMGLGAGHARRGGCAWFPGDFAPCGLRPMGGRGSCRGTRRLPSRKKSLFLPL